MYSFPLPICGIKGIDQTNLYGSYAKHGQSLDAWGWMDVSWGLTEFGVGMLAFITGLGHLQYISLISFLNLHHHISLQKHIGCC